MRIARHRNALGFTLIELMVAVAVLAVIVSLASPSFRALMEAQRMRSAAFDLMADITLARSEALKRGEISTPVTLTRDASNATGRWESGWSVTVGTEVLSRKSSAGAGVVIRGPATVTFDRNGRASNLTNVARFAFTSSSAAQNRCISIDPSGRPKSSTAVCPT